MATDHNFKVKNGLTVEGGEIYLQGVATPQIFFNGNADAGIDMAIKATPESLDFYEPEDADKLHMRIIDDAGVNAVFGFRTGAGDGTIRLDASGNLQNIGTISSGAITSSGNIAITAGTGQRHIEIASGTTNAKTYRIYNGISWNPDALLIYNHTDDSTVLTIEPGKLGVNRGASSLSHTLDVGGTVAISGTTVIDSSRNLTNIGTISSGAITANGGSTQSVIKSTSDAPLIVESTDNYSGINFKDPGGNSSMYYLGSSDHLYLHSAKFSVAGSTLVSGYQFQVNGSANLTGSLAIGGAQVIAASTRNLTNIGTISSGALTTTGNSTHGGYSSWTAGSGTGGIFIHYNSTNSYRGYFDWRTLQLGNNGANNILAGNTSAGGYLRFYTNATGISQSGGTSGNLALTLQADADALFGGNLYIPEYLYHTDNTATNLRFETDKAVMTASHIAVTAGAANNQKFEIGSSSSNTPVGFLFETLNKNGTATSDKSLRMFMSETGYNSGASDYPYKYGVSLVYEGSGAAPLDFDSGFTSAIGNGEWGIYGHEDTVDGTLIVHSNRSGSFYNIKISGTNALAINSSRNATFAGTISSGAITSSGQVTGTSLQARNDSGYGTVEVGGSSGAFIDLKKPATDDYDVRIVTDAGTGGRIQSNGVFDIDAAGDITLDADGGDIHLKDNGSSMASFTTGAATFAGTISSGAITSTVINTGDATLLTLHHDTGADITQQKSFIDFSFEDDNTNETPQVRIGAEVGQNADANQQTLEGSGAFVVYTNNADSTAGAAGTSLVERMRVDYRGYVGIGTTTPGVELDIKRHTNAYPLRIGSEGGQGRAIVFADVASTPTKYNWLVGAQYNINNSFEITPSTAIGGYTFSNPGLLVDTGGNIFIGKSNNSLANAGVVLRNGGELFLTRAGDVANFNRTGTSGVVTYWRYDDNPVGEIGIEGGDSLYIQATGSTGSGLRFHPSAGTVEPVRNGVTINNTINLGSATRQFKDGYFEKVYVRQNTAAAGAVLEFSDEPSSWSQNGSITFRHADTQSYGSGAMFEIGSDQPTTTILAQGKLYFSEGLYTKPASGTGLGTLRISDSGNATLGTISSGAITSSGVLDLTVGAVSGAVMGANRSLGINATEAQIHLVAHNTGDWASNIVLTNHSDSATRHYWIHNAPATASANANKFELRTSTTTTAAQIGGQGSGSTAVLVVDSLGNTTTKGNISIDAADGFVYLNNDGVGNAGIYVRGIGSTDTLRSHSTDNFRWEVLGSQKMELTNSGHLTVTGNLNGAIITGSNLNVEGLVKFGDVAGSPAADIHVYGTGNNYLRLSGTGANDYEIDLQGTSSVGSLLINQFDLKVTNNVIIDGSSKYLIIENHAETDTGIIFNDGDASTGGNWNGSSSQAFKIQYHCGNETLIMGHDDDSYAGFNFGKGGALTCSGNITAYSDERLKENIETLDGSKVLQMRGVSFTKEGKQGSGVIAQELEKVAPELVSDGEYKSVAYGNLTGYLIEAIKEQQEKIEKLEELVEKLISEK